LHWQRWASAKVILGSLGVNDEFENIWKVRFEAKSAEKGVGGGRSADATCF